MKQWEVYLVKLPHLWILPGKLFLLLTERCGLIQVGEAQDGDEGNAAATDGLNRAKSS